MTTAVGIGLGVGWLIVGGTVVWRSRTNRVAYLGLLIAALGPALILNWIIP